MTKLLSDEERKRVKRRYEIPEDILSLMASAEVLGEFSQRLPIEYQKATYDYIRKLKNMAGFDEKEYLNWAEKKRTYIIEAEFEKECEE